MTSPSQRAAGKCPEHGLQIDPQRGGCVICRRSSKPAQPIVDESDARRSPLVLFLAGLALCGGIALGVFAARKLFQSDEVAAVENLTGTIPEEVMPCAQAEERCQVSCAKERLTGDNKWNPPCIACLNAMVLCLEKNAGLELPGSGDAAAFFTVGAALDLDEVRNQLVEAADPLGATCPSEHSETGTFRLQVHGETGAVRATILATGEGMGQCFKRALSKLTLPPADNDYVVLGAVSSRPRRPTHSRSLMDEDSTLPNDVYKLKKGEDVNSVVRERARNGEGGSVTTIELPRPIRNS